MLKVWNGRAYCCYKPGAPEWASARRWGEGRIYACAYSVADLRRMIAEYCGRDPGRTELSDYWSAGAWGNSMDGIARKRGLWLTLDRERPALIFDGS